MKLCSSCKSNKSLDQFWKSKRTKDGLKCYCIECSRAKNKEYLKNGYMAKYMAQYYKKNDQARKEKGQRSNRYNLKTGHSIIYGKVRSQIESGKIAKKSCMICKSIIVHAHHKDYSKPLDLTWLCPSHHKAVHMGVLQV
jgi:hypothetical protein